MNSRFLRIVSAAIALMLIIPAASSAARRPNPRNMQRYLQQAQEQQRQIQAAQQAALVREAAAQKAAEEHRMEMHRRASQDRRDKAEAALERARQRRLEEAHANSKATTATHKPTKPGSDS